MHRQDLVEGTLASCQVFGQNHLAHGLNPVSLKKHMLGAAQSDSLGTKIACHLGIIGGVGVCSHLEATETVGPGHQGSEIATNLRFDLGHITKQHFTGGAIEGDIFPAFYHQSRFSDKLLFLIINFDCTTAGNTTLPHATGNDGGMGGHPATGGQDAARGVHTMDILRAGFNPDKDDILLQSRHFFSFIGREDDLTTGRSG